MSTDAIGALWRRILVLIGRGRVTGVDDTRSAQVLQVKLGDDETKDETPRAAEYGFVSNPPPGTDAVVIFLGGERTNGVVVATNNQTFRMRNLASGDVAIHDNRGRFVLLSAAGIHVQGNADPVLVETTGTIRASAGGDIDAMSTGGNINLNATAGEIVLSAQTIRVDASVSIDIRAPLITAEATALGLTAATTLTGTTAVVGVTSIAGATSITGALTNNGHNVGDGHTHPPGTFHAGGTAITGTSGNPS